MDAETGEIIEVLPHFSEIFPDWDVPTEEITEYEVDALPQIGVGPDDWLRFCSKRVYLEEASQSQNADSFETFQNDPYLKGEVVRKDTRKAMDHIYTSAQAGNPHAQYLLGKLLLQGKVVQRDKDEGIQWLARAAEQGHSYAQCLLDRQHASTAPEVFLAVTRLLHHMANIFQDNSLPQSGTGLIHADRKLREQLREKRLAHGHKEDDHEEQQYGGWNMTMK